MSNTTRHSFRMVPPFLVIEKKGKDGASEGFAVMNTIDPSGVLPCTNGCGRSTAQYMVHGEDWEEILCPECFADGFPNYSINTIVDVHGNISVPN